MEPVFDNQIFIGSELVEPSPDWWWFVIGLFVLISVIFFAVTLYHWLRYETNSKLSTIIISSNGLISVILLGGAATSLMAYLNSLN